MKKRKRLISLFLVALLVLNFRVSFASTNDNMTQGVTDDTVTVSKNIKYSIRGSEASTVMYQRLSDMDITIKDETLIEFVPIDSRNDATAMIVTNTEESVVTKDIVLGIDKEGQIQDLSIIDENQVSTRAGGYGDLEYNDIFTIRGTAVYNQLRYGTSSAYYQPIGAYIICEDCNDCSLSYVQAVYQCTGYEVTYPGFEYVSNNSNMIENLFTYNIVIEKTYPTANTIYHKVDEYRTDRAIYTENGTFGMGGQFFLFDFTVNSISDSVAVRIYNNQ